MNTLAVLSRSTGSLFLALLLGQSLPASASPLPPADAVVSSGPFLALPASGGTGARCQSDTRTLCLLDGAISVRARWRNQRTDLEGAGTSRALGERSGAFWFFREDNLEILVKALDGSQRNGHFWIFLGSLSDVEFWVDVEAIGSGLKKTYYNPPGNLYGIGDVQALPSEALTCAGIAGTPCPADLYCDLQQGCGIADAAGVCVEIPEACTTVFDPVCGCDGMTYGNECERLRARVVKDRDGSCDEPAP